MRFGLAVARRLMSRLPRVFARRAVPMLHGLIGGLSLSISVLATSSAVAEQGHCMAAGLAGGCIQTATKDAEGNLVPGMHVYFTDPTERYRHGVLGDSVEWGGLAYVQQGSAGHGPYAMDAIVLPKDHVFEDLTPRLADVTGDGRAEIIVIETDVNQGAALAIYQITDGTLSKLAETPHIGTSNRWLAPLGAADLDGDGAVELAYVDRPHLAKTLRVWRFSDGGLSEVAAISGVTNHRIGEDFISGGIRDCGDGPEMITADARWNRVMATRFQDGELQPSDIGAFAGRGSFDAAMACE